jgi:hypothetical protein
VLDAEFREALAEAEDRAAGFETELETLRVAARKADLDVELLCLAWVPCRITPDGVAERVAHLDA